MNYIKALERLVEDYKYYIIHDFSPWSKDEDLKTIKEVEEFIKLLITKQGE